MKVCSAGRFPRLIGITDVPKGKMRIPSALANWTHCRGCKSVTDISLYDKAGSSRVQQNGNGETAY